MMWKIIDFILEIIVLLGTTLCIMEILNLENAYAYYAFLLAILVFARLNEKANEEHREELLHTYSAGENKILSKLPLIKFVYEANYTNCSIILNIQLPTNSHEKLVINLKNNLNIPINMEYLDWLKTQTDLNLLDHYIQNNPKQNIKEYQDLLMFCETKIKYNI